MFVQILLIRHYDLQPSLIWNESKLADTILASPTGQPI